MVVGEEAGEKKCRVGFSSLIPRPAILSELQAGAGGGLWIVADSGSLWGEFMAQGNPSAGIKPSGHLKPSVLGVLGILNSPHTRRASVIPPQRGGPQRDPGQA